MEVPPQRHGDDERWRNGQGNKEDARCENEPGKVGGYYRYRSGIVQDHDADEPQDNCQQGGHSHGDAGPDITTRCVRKPSGTEPPTDRSSHSTNYCVLIYKYAFEMKIVRLTSGVKC